MNVVNAAGMETFSGRDYVAIDLANHAGFDKLSWQERISWVNSVELTEHIPSDPKTKYLYIKAMTAYRSTTPTGFIMGLDATNSGVQILSALGKCRTSALTCNLINTGKREDLYSTVMEKIPKTVSITRDQVKKAIVPMMYGSKAAPRNLFGEDTIELKIFAASVKKAVPILGELRALTEAAWNPNATYHAFELPDGHVAVLPALKDKKHRFEIKGTSFTFQYEAVEANKNSMSLLANITHAVDGYVAREMVRRADKAGFLLAHIHDSFWAHPNHMNEVRQFYKDILIEIAKSTLLEDILSQISGEPVQLNYPDPELWKEMSDAEYMLS